MSQNSYPLLKPYIRLIVASDIYLLKSMQSITLPYIIPDITKAIGYKAGIRPYREGGVRMQKSNEGNGKTVYHDYGHGGAGISIAYGCAKHVVQNIFARENAPLGTEVGVLGAGIVGLSTAYLLIKKGYKVNLYAELTPFQRLKDRPEITSTVAAGYWMPLKVGNKLETVTTAVDTWNHYEEVRQLQTKLGRKFGITLLPAYALNDEAENYHFHIPGVIDPKPCRVTFGDGIYYNAKKFDTYVVQPELYCSFLREQMEKSGKYRFFNGAFKSKEDVLSLKETHIFNCIGFGSRDIFGDKKLKAIKGHVLKFKLSQHEKVGNFLLVMALGKEGKELHLQVPQPQSGNFAIGVTFQQGKDDTNVDMQSVNYIINRGRQFFLKVEANKVRPKL